MDQEDFFFSLFFILFFNYSRHAMLYLFLVYIIVIPHLFTLWVDRRNSRYHSSLQSVDCIPYVTAQWLIHVITGGLWLNLSHLFICFIQPPTSSFLKTTRVSASMSLILFVLFSFADAPCKWRHDICLSLSDLFHLA